MSRARLKAQKGLLSSNPARYACLSALTSEPVRNARQARLESASRAHWRPVYRVLEQPCCYPEAINQAQARRSVMV